MSQASLKFNHADFKFDNNNNLAATIVQKTRKGEKFAN